MFSDSPDLECLRKYVGMNFIAPIQKILKK